MSKIKGLIPVTIVYKGSVCGSPNVDCPHDGRKYLTTECTLFGIPRMKNTKKLYTKDGELRYFRCKQCILALGAGDDCL